MVLGVPILKHFRVTFFKICRQKFVVCILVVKFRSMIRPHPCPIWGGRVVQWCWVNFQCRGVLLIWIKVGQGPTALTVGASGGYLNIFLSSVTSLPSPSLWKTARYRLKYCLKGPLSPKNQPTKHGLSVCLDVFF